MPAVVALAVTVTSVAVAMDCRFLYHCGAKAVWVALPGQNASPK